MLDLLSGVKVVSMAWQYPGPYCTLLLADLGAEVIVVERPGGDPARYRPEFFEAINRNKKSVCINLQKVEGREICYRLIERADVFLEGFRPGVTAKLGIDYATLQRHNPRLIYISISGYGQNGPYARWPGHDISYQGVAGMVAEAELTDAELLPRVATADLSSGMFATVAALAALRFRERTGKGTYIDVSMTDGLVSWMSAPLSIFLNTGAVTRAREPAYGVFKAKDDKYFTLSIAHEDHFWANLCRVLGKDDFAQLTREQRVARRDELVTWLKSAFQKRKRDEWVELLVSHDVPAAPVNDYLAAVNDPQLNYRGMFFEIECQGRRLKQVAHPLKFSEALQKKDTPPPQLGEHTKEVLTALGYSEQEIGQLSKLGVIYLS